MEKINENTISQPPQNQKDKPKDKPEDEETEERKKEKERESLFAYIGQVAVDFSRGIHKEIIGTGGKISEKKKEIENFSPLLKISLIKKFFSLCLKTSSEFPREPEEAKIFRDMRELKELEKSSTELEKGENEIKNKSEGVSKLNQLWGIKNYEKIELILHNCHVLFIDERFKKYFRGTEADLENLIKKIDNFLLELIKLETSAKVEIPAKERTISPPPTMEKKEKREKFKEEFLKELNEMLADPDMVYFKGTIETVKEDVENNEFDLAKKLIWEILRGLTLLRKKKEYSQEEITAITKKLYGFLNIIGSL